MAKPSSVATVGDDSLLAHRRPAKHGLSRVSFLLRPTTLPDLRTSPAIMGIIPAGGPGSGRNHHVGTRLFHVPCSCCIHRHPVPFAQISSSTLRGRQDPPAPKARVWNRTGAPKNRDTLPARGWAI